MKANKMALAISNLHGSRFVPVTASADIPSLLVPDDGLVKIRENIENKTMVRFITIDGKPIELSPGLTLKEGPVSCIIKTSEHTHTFEVISDFSTGKVSSSLKSVLNNTGEEVDLFGEWQITYISSNYTRKSRRSIEPVRKIDWAEEARKLIKQTGGRYSSLRINHDR